MVQISKRQAVISGLMYVSRDLLKPITRGVSFKRYTYSSPNTLGFEINIYRPCHGT